MLNYTVEIKQHLARASAYILVCNTAHYKNSFRYPNPVPADSRLHVVQFPFLYIYHDIV